MPSSRDPQKDLQIFRMILTMDDEGLWRRKNKPLPAKRLRELLGTEWDDYRQAIKEEKKALEKKAFLKMGYDEKIRYCLRPEQINGPSESAWKEINAHLGTAANSLPELIEELGKKRWGRVPRVGDTFCGGGSIPFEAARLGADTFASDLNPVATLLTWGAVNILCSGKNARRTVEENLRKAYEAADERIVELGIEHNDRGERADAYLYCVEVVCPSTGYLLPLAPSWIISEKERVCALLRRNEKKRGYDIEIVTDPDEASWEKAKRGTVGEGYVICPETGEKFSVRELRGDNKIEGKTRYGLRLWESGEIAAREEDLFRERLYCIRWKAPDGARSYRAPTAEDLEKERLVLELAEKGLGEWQERGFIPSSSFDPNGFNTCQPVRERGWTHWHHLFTPRQLLYNACLMEEAAKIEDKRSRAAALLGIGSCANWNSRLSHWDKGRDNVNDTFYNQALNTLFAFSSRGFSLLRNNFNFKFRELFGVEKPLLRVAPQDARDVGESCDIWITDPPYADAVHYHELADFFLAWYEKGLTGIFPEWYCDGRQALAVRGTGGDFKRSLAEIYSHLCRRMPEDGLQVVMFNHKSDKIWRDFADVMSAAGLSLANKWEVVTETESRGIRKGDYLNKTFVMVFIKNHLLKSRF